MDLSMQPLAKGHESGDDLIRSCPCSNGAGNIFIAVEPEEKLDHSVYVVGIIPSFDEPSPDTVEIGLAPLAEFHPGFMVALVYLHKALELLIVGLVMCTGIF